MKYEIVANSKPLRLEKEVNERISDGWFPQGGLSISDGNKVTIYCQAMIKHDEVNINIRVPKTGLVVNFDMFADDYIE